MKQFDDVSCSRGAPMGRSTIAEDPAAKVHLFRVRLVGGDYDDGGAYWGGPPSPPLFCARDDAGTFLQFSRASNRGVAKQQLQRRWPQLRFYR